MSESQIPVRRVFPAPPPSSSVRAPEEVQRRDRRNLILIVCGSVLALVFVIYLGFGLKKSGGEARGLADALHGDMQRKEYDVIFEDASDAWQKKMTLEKTRTFFGGIEEKVGTPVWTEQTGFRANFQNDRQYLTASYTTRFSVDNEMATEVIRWQFEDGKYKLLSYNVDSPKLEAK